MNTLSVVHDVLQRQVREGDFCIDATAGKGRDTALLCRLTGENGRVLAFDVQEDAVRQTRELLAKEHLSAEVYLDSHANMAHYAEPETVDCIVFNFGRLPGGDPSIFTQADSSVAALEAALRLLKPGDEITTVWYLSDWSEDSGFEAYESETLTVTADTAFYEQALPDGEYLMIFEMRDSQGNSAYSQGIGFTVDGEDITTSVYE